MEELQRPIRVIVAEDDYLVREGTRAVLDAHPETEVVGTASDPASLEALFEDREVDAAILDIRMPPTHTTEGIDLALKLREIHPDVGIVVLSQHHDPEYVLALLEGGSERLAYLLKERLGQADELIRALREVTSGGSVLDPRIVNELLEAKRRRRSSRLSDLTPREMDVLAEMATGKQNSAIAAKLFISERSVEKHASSIFSKLGLSDSTDLNRRVAAVLFFLQRSSD